MTGTGPDQRHVRDSNQSGTRAKPNPDSGSALQPLNHWTSPDLTETADETSGKEKR